MGWRLLLLGVGLVGFRFRLDDRATLHPLLLRRMRTRAKHLLLLPLRKNNVMLLQLRLLPLPRKKMANRRLSLLLRMDMANLLLLLVLLARRNVAILPLLLRPSLRKAMANLPVRLVLMMKRVNQLLLLLFLGRRRPLYYSYSYYCHHWEESGQSTTTTTAKDEVEQM